MRSNGDMDEGSLTRLFLSFLSIKKPKGEFKADRNKRQEEPCIHSCSLNQQKKREFKYGRHYMGSSMGVRCVYV